MQEIVRLFTQIALLRRGPQDLPASVLLLGLTLAGYLGVNVLVSALLPPVSDWPLQLLVDTLFMLAWYAALLRLVGRPERILQTSTAVFGLQTVLSPPLIASAWLMRRFGEQTLWQLPIAFVGLLLLVWLIAASGHVVKAALGWSVTPSIMLVILQIFCGQLLLFALFPGPVRP
ncbi:MAG TPA: hypothetical protein VK676_03360 [Steroidobacteraceae bacterium]|jgi:hypothetical protein|nr:hypothetical protein [Steroidobacteraceae bacterium]